MKITTTGKQRFEEASERATSWVDARKDDDGVVGLATQLYARDQDVFASVLGSAIALRLFLFVIPANVALLGLINIFRLGGPLSSILTSSPTTGLMAESYSTLSPLRSLWIAVTGTVLTLWAGRSLTRVLATCSAAAWQLPATTAKLATRGIVALTGMLFALMLASASFAYMRENGGVAVSVSAWVVVAAVVSVGWFVVQLVLPRGTQDPGSALPGAVLMGVGFAILQWFMQIYLPGKIERTTDTMGALASTVATLGYFFFIGRLMASSFVVGAIVFQRWGSISEFVFELPGLRRLPARSARLRTFFDLGRSDDEPGDTGAITTGISATETGDDGPTPFPLA